MFDDIIKKIKNVIKGKPREQKYITRSPAGKTPEELADIYNKKLLKQNAEETARRKRAEQKAEKLEEQKNKLQRKEQEEEVKQRIKEANEYEENKKKKRNSVQLKLTKDNLPLFYYKDNSGNNKYSYLWGFELFENPDGYTVFYPILTDEKKAKKSENKVRLKEGSTGFKDFFKENMGIVSQLKAGKFDTNFQRDNDGNLYLAETTNENDSNNDGVPPQEVKKLQNRMAELKKRLSMASHELEQAGEREEKNQAKIQELQAKNSSLKTKSEEYAKGWMKAKQKEADFARLAVDATAHLQDKEIGQTLSERLNWTLKEGVERREKMLKNELKRTSNKKEAEKIRQTYDDVQKTFSMLQNNIESGSGKGQ